VDIGALVAAGVDAVHLSASRAVAGDGGPGGGGASGHTVTDPDVVAAAVAALVRVDTLSSTRNGSQRVPPRQ